MSKDRYLRIYLADHHAGSVAGLELARRCAKSNEDNAIGRWLRTTGVPAIEEDRDALRRVMKLVEAHPSHWKNAAFWAGEKLGRFKLNGELTSYSPLSRLVELEGLTSGVSAKLSLWQCLSETGDPRLESIDFAELTSRAQEQLKGLELQRRKASAMAFGTAG